MKKLLNETETASSSSNKESTEVLEVIPEESEEDIERSSDKKTSHDNGQKRKSETAQNSEEKNKQVVESTVDYPGFNTDIALTTVNDHYGFASKYLHLSITGTNELTLTVLPAAEQFDISSEQVASFFYKVEEIKSNADYSNSFRDLASQISEKYNTGKLKIDCLSSVTIHFSDVSLQLLSENNQTNILYTVCSSFTSYDISGSNASSCTFEGDFRNKINEGSPLEISANQINRMVLSGKETTILNVHLGLVNFFDAKEISDKSQISILKNDGNGKETLEKVQNGKFIWNGSLSILDSISGENTIGSINNCGNNAQLSLINNGLLHCFASNSLSDISIQGTGTTKFYKGNDSWKNLKSISVDQSSFSTEDEGTFASTTLAHFNAKEGTCSKIAIGSFLDAQLSSATEINKLISGLTRIEDRSFYGNAISGKITSEKVTEIGLNAFGNNRISSIEFPNLTMAEELAFYQNQISEFSLPNLKQIMERTLARNNLTKLDISKDLSSVTKIGTTAFSENPIDELILPDNSVEISSAAFYSLEYENPQKIENLTVPYERLAKSKLETVLGSDNIKNIKRLTVTDGEIITKKNTSISQLVSFDSLEEVHLPQTKVVGEEIFSNHPTLKRLYDVDNVVEVQANAFARCGLEKASFGNLIKIGAHAFEHNVITNFDAPNLEILDHAGLASNYLSEANFEKLHTCYGTNNLSNNRISSFSLKNLEVITESFLYNNLLTTIDFQKDFPKVKTIGKLAFAQNLELKKITLPEESVDVNLEKDNEIFSGDTGIKEINTPYKRFAKSDTKGTFGLYFPDALNSVETLTFTGDDVISREEVATELSNLTELRLPDTIEVGDLAFKGLTKLGKIEAPNVELIGASAFSEANLSSETRIDGRYEHEVNGETKGLYLPKVKQIGENAFANSNHQSKGNSVLVSNQGLDFPMLESVGNNAFSGWNLGVLRTPNLKNFSPSAFNNTEGIGLLLVSKTNAKTIDECIQNQAAYDDSEGKSINYHVNAITLSSSELSSGEIDDKWTNKGIHYDILGKFATNEGDLENANGYYWYKSNLEVKSGTQHVASGDGMGNVQLDAVSKGDYNLFIELTNGTDEMATVNLGKFTLNEGTQAVVQDEDLGNQQWLINAVNKALGKTVGEDVTFEDLKTITNLTDMSSIKEESCIPKEIKL